MKGIIKMTTAKKICKYLIFVFAFVMLLSAFSMGVSAQEETEAVETAAQVQEDSSGEKALAAAITVGLAAAAGAIGMGIAIAKSVEGISRQPEAEGKIRTSLMLGLVFVETAIIYALIIAVLIIFVL